jgi:hypothetical protein
MSEFTIHTLETAPADSKNVLTAQLQPFAWEPASA